MPNESIGPHVSKGVLSQWDGVAHEGSVGDEPMVLKGPEDGLVG